MSAPPGISTNPFEVLGLERSASFEDVKVAYRRLAREYHPDANPDDPGALDRFTAVRRAYDRLKVFYQTGKDIVPAGTAGIPTGEAPTAPGEEPTIPPTATTPWADATPSTAPGQTATGPAMDAMPAAEVSGLGAAPVAPGPGSAPVPGTGARTAIPESGLPGTGSRRAFHRSGPIRPPSEITFDGSAQGRPSGGSAPLQARLSTPQQFGSGHQAGRAEVILGRSRVPAGDAPVMLYALVGVRASDGVVFPRIPLNLCLVLDHSSSMLRGGKVERLKETVHTIIEHLDEDDFLSIVTFGDRAEVLLPAQPLRNKALVQGAIDAIHCRGGTEISRGLAAGLSELSRNASRALSHLILLTDGQTRGDEMVCLERAREAADTSVGITAYGLGTDWNNGLLDAIATPTGGYSDYIESPQEMLAAFCARVVNLQGTTLHKVVLAVRPGEGHLVQRATVISPVLRPLETAIGTGTPATSAPVWALGDISGTTEHSVLCEFILGPRQPGTTTVATLTLSYDVPGLQRTDETLAVPITVPVAADATVDDAEQMDARVVEALRHMTIHRLQQQAWVELTITGNLDKGTGLLKRAAEHLTVAGRADLAEVTAAEAARVEGGERASEESIKRIIYGTRKLG